MAVLISNQRMFLGALGKVKKLNDYFIIANSHDYTASSYQ